MCGVSENITKIVRGLLFPEYNRKFICDTVSKNSLLDSKNVRLYKLSCECGIMYFGNTRKPLGVRVGEHKRNGKEIGLIPRMWLSTYGMNRIKFYGRILKL